MPGTSREPAFLTGAGDPPSEPWEGAQPCSCHLGDSPGKLVLDFRPPDCERRHPCRSAAQSAVICVAAPVHDALKQPAGALGGWRWRWGEQVPPTTALPRSLEWALAPWDPGQLAAGWISIHRAHEGPHRPLKGRLKAADWLWSGAAAIWPHVQNTHGQETTERRGGGEWGPRCHRCLQGVAACTGLGSAVIPAPPDLLAPPGDTASWAYRDPGNVHPPNVLQPPPRTAQLCWSHQVV